MFDNRTSHCFINGKQSLYLCAATISIREWNALHCCYAPVDWCTCLQHWFSCAGFLLVGDLLTKADEHPLPRCVSLRGPFLWQDLMRQP